MAEIKEAGRLKVWTMLHRSKGVLTSAGSNKYLISLKISIKWSYFPFSTLRLIKFFLYQDVHLLRCGCP